MARLLRIQRALTWLAKAFTADRDPLPIPTGYGDAIIPTVDIFGSSRAEQIRVFESGAGLGALEWSHSPSPPDRVRHYLSIEYWTDDGVGRRMRPGRILTASGAFPFSGFRDEITMSGNFKRSSRNITIGPNQRIAVQANLMGGGAQIFANVVWVEMPIGEYVRGIE